MTYTRRKTMTDRADTFNAVAESLAQDKGVPLEFADRAIDSLRSIGTKLDSLPSEAKLPVRDRKFVTVDKIQPNVLCLNEYDSDSWNKVAAFAIVRMIYGQFTEMMERVEAIIEEMEERNPEEDALLRGRNALQQWSREVLKE